MRALFTQLSLLVGLLAGLNFQADGASLIEATLLGLMAGCTAFIVLIVGDAVVHRLLEERPDDISSVIFLGTPPEYEAAAVDTSQTDADQSDDAGSKAA